MLNTLTLAIHTYDETDMQARVVHILNDVFTWVFFGEMIIKIIGLGFNNYIKDRYNLFDAIIVIISLVDWTLY